MRLCGAGRAPVGPSRPVRRRRTGGAARAQSRGRGSSDAAVEGPVESLASAVSAAKGFVLWAERAAAEAAGVERGGDEKYAVSPQQAAEAAAALGLTLGDKLGTGGYSVVWQAEVTPGSESVAVAHWDGAKPGDQVAVKVLLTRAPDAVAEFEREVALWSRLTGHRSVVQLLYARSAPVPLAVMELCTGSKLWNRVASPTAAIDVRHVALDVARALVHMHKLGYCHRDLKSANVLLTDAPEGGIAAKLSDFGSAAPLRTVATRPKAPDLPFVQAEPWKPIGTLLWMAPEMLDPPLEGEVSPRAPGGEKADVYSYAILLWELFEHRLPWTRDEKVSRESVIRAVCEDGYRPPIADWVAPKVRALMQECLAVDPKKRPSMRQVLSRLESIPAWDTDGHLKLEAIASQAGVDRPNARADPAPADVEMDATASDELNESAELVMDAEDGGEPLVPMGDGGELVFTAEELSRDRPLSAAQRATMAAGASRMNRVEKTLPKTASAAGLGDRVSSAIELIEALYPAAFEGADPKLVKRLAKEERALERTAKRLDELEARKRFDPLAAMSYERTAREFELESARIELERAEVSAVAWLRSTDLLAVALDKALLELADANERLTSARELTERLKKKG